MKNTKIKATGGLVLAAAMLLSVFGIYPCFTRAAAEEKALYYIGDNAGGRTACFESLKAAGAIGSYHISDFSQDPAVKFMLYATSNGYGAIHDAYVIVEMSTPIQRQGIGEENIIFTDIFFDMFDYLKEKNCEIMFICGTAEWRMEPYTSFLDYADIHINTDIEFIFFGNVFAEIAEACESDALQDAGLIFNAELLGYATTKKEIIDSDFFKTWFTPYFLGVYREETSGKDASIVFGENSILCQVGEDEFFDPAHDKSYYLQDSDEIAQALEWGNNFSVGKAVMTSASDWFDVVDEMADCAGSEISRYIYNVGGMPIADSDVFDTGTLTSIDPVIESFVNDEDLSEYDNIEGRCAVTHLPMPMGEGGWMDVAAGESNPGWKVFMSAEDYNYFSNNGKDNEFSIDWNLT